MIRKIFYILIMVGAIFYLPWPLALAAIIVWAAVIETYYVVVLPTLFFDWFYGLAGGLPVGLVVMTLAVPLTLFSKRLIRLKT